MAESLKPFVLVPRDKSLEGRGLITSYEQRRPIEGYPGQFIRFQALKTGRIDPDAGRGWDVISNQDVPLKRHEVPFDQQSRRRLAPFNPDRIREKRRKSAQERYKFWERSHQQ